jgi:hypothetical protein
MHAFHCGPLTAFTAGGRDYEVAPIHQFIELRTSHWNSPYQVDVGRVIQLTVVEFIKIRLDILTDIEVCFHLNESLKQKIQAFVNIAPTGEEQELVPSSSKVLPRPVITVIVICSII